MTIRRAKFYKIFQEEGAPFYIDRFNINENEFDNWVVNNFTELATINDFQEVVPSNQMFEKFLKEGYEHRAHQCHYSAKAVNIIDPNFEFWTGFVHRQDFIQYSIITHSFNVYKGKIIDFARVNQDLSVSNKGDLYLPHVYYGINIPSEFILQYKDSVMSNYSMNPLLFEWFNHKRDHD